MFEKCIGFGKSQLFVKTKNGKYTGTLLLNTLITYCSLKATGKINIFLYWLISVTF